MTPPDDGLSSAPTPLAPHVEAASNNLQPRTASAANKAPLGAHSGVAAGAGGADEGARRRVGTHGNTGAAAAAAAAAAASTAAPSPPLPVPPQATRTTSPAQPTAVAARAGGADEGTRRRGTHGSTGAAGSQTANPSHRADDAAALLSLTGHGPHAAARAIAPTPDAAIDLTTDSTQESPAVSRVHPQLPARPSGSGSTDTRKRPRRSVRRGTTVGERVSGLSRKKARLKLHRGRGAEDDSYQSRDVGASPSNEAEGYVPSPARSAAAAPPRYGFHCRVRVFTPILTHDVLIPCLLCSIVHGGDGGAMRHHGQEALGANVSNTSGTRWVVWRVRLVWGAAVAFV